MTIFKRLQKAKNANRPIHPIPMPSALLSHIMLKQAVRQKQVGIPDRGRGKVCIRSITPMKELYENVAFVVYPVSDMQSSRAFYSGVLELDETACFGDRWIEYDIGHGTLAITNTFPHLIPGASGAIMAIEVSDLEKIDHALRAKSVAWATGPFDTPECRGGSIKDPDGNEIILHLKKEKPNGDGP